MSQADIRPIPRRLSVVMIVCNEEEVLETSLTSAQEIADELIVVDTGSTDRTVDLARNAKAEVIHCPWNHNFSAARNRGLRRATGDWILWLDAGESLDIKAAQSLREFVDTQADASRAYMLMVRIPPALLGASGEQVAQLRLLPNISTLQYAGRVRETLASSLAEAGLNIDTLDATIQRHPRHHDPACKAAIAQRNIELARMETTETEGPLPARLHLVMGDAHADLGELSEAIQAYQRAIEAAEHGSTAMLEGYYGLLTTCDSWTADSGTTDFGRATTTCLEALEVYPFDAQLLLAMGNYMRAQGRLDLAARSFELAVQYGQVDLETWHLSDLSELATDCLSLTRQLLGNDIQAAEILDNSLAHHPHSQRLIRRLLELRIKHQQLDEALELVERLPLESQERKLLSDVVRGACEATAHRWTPALGYLQSAYVAGCHDPLCLRWLSVTLLSNGCVEEAHPVLEQWLCLEPHNTEVNTYLNALRSTGMPPVTERHLRVDTSQPITMPVDAQAPIISQFTSADSDEG